MLTNPMFDLIQDLQNTNHREVKDTGLDLITVQKYLQRLNFDEAFNNHLSWDKNSKKSVPENLHRH